MEAKAPFYRRRKPSSSDRFISLFSHSPPSTASGDELSEGDVLWTGESAESSHHSSPPSTSSTPPLHQRHVNSKVFDGALNFGVLAAVRDAGHDTNNRSVFNHKTSVSPSSSLSARMIPILPRPPVERSGGMSLKFQQSAPVSVPVMPSNGRTRQKGSGFDSQDDEDDEEESEMLPPHELVARQSAKSPILSCSVLEGAGRTLKGRDLRQTCGLDIIVRARIRLDAALFSWVLCCQRQGAMKVVGFNPTPEARASSDTTHLCLHS